MKRTHFIQSMLTLTGTAFVYGCKDIIDSPEDQPVYNGYASPTVPEAKRWFTNSYLRKLANARTQETSVSRTLDWENLEVVKSGKHDFIWIPVEYEGDEIGTALLMWQPGEEYVQKLAEYLSWSISEGFVVYRKPNGDYDGFLAQMAFDPTMTDLTNPIDFTRFTGMVVNADINENILRSWRFLEGKMISYNNPDKNKEKVTRTNCQTYYTQYTTVTGHPCGPNCTEVTYTVHSAPHTYGCDDANASDPNYMGSGTNYSGNWDGYGSGGGTPPPKPRALTNKRQLATNANSWERKEFNKRLTDAVNAVGLGASSLDLSLSKANTIANALSVSNTGLKVTFVPAFTILGRAVSGIGAATSGYSFILGVAKDGDINWWGQDGLNALATAAGIAAVIASPIGWWALSLSLASSGISIGIAVYDAQRSYEAPGHGR